jgi:hypothetical protein
MELELLELIRLREVRTKARVDDRVLEVSAGHLVDDPLDARRTALPLEQ